MGVFMEIVCMKPCDVCKQLKSGLVYKGYDETKRPKKLIEKLCQDCFKKKYPDAQLIQ